ncbi:cupin domain-containing protein [Tsukamurella sp. NPDC003166]|uniref:cupin domain-containing protein n=1 Tax=Tsukamurella sp. NPDC003166 TaxID=3154444 RepID=UPI0033B95CEF
MSPERTRVVVTSVTESGGSRLEDLTVEQTINRGPDGEVLFSGTFLWGTPDGIDRVGPDHDLPSTTVPFFPGPGGHRFYLFTFMPESDERQSVSRAAIDGDTFVGLADTVDDSDAGRHRSDTVDYAYVVSGRVTLETDDGQVDLGPGDTVVQRGTWHTWRNTGTEPCVVACVLIGAERT